MKAAARTVKKPPSRVVYPESDHMGEHEIQRLIAELLRPLVDRYLARQGKSAHVGADQFIYWEEGNPTCRLAPDVYVLPGVDREVAIASWKTWETGVAPSFALEVVGSDIGKDYLDAPAEYAKLGVSELVVFDPHATATSRTRIRWQVFRRVARRGLVRVEVSQGDRVRSKVLGAWLRSVGAGGALRLRIGTGSEGDTLFPTEAEEERALKEAERAEKEAERAAKEQERAEKEAERALRLEAQAEIARLRELLEGKGR
jgi:hypothetical protein